MYDSGIILDDEESRPNGRLFFLDQRKKWVGDVHENGFHAASPAKERLDEGFISITPVIASSTLSRKASGRRFFPFVTAFWGNLLDSLPRKG